ncbi:thioesterase II family protein [Spirillospora sp. NPDC048824]|uniref:thioesterase II family protein n=1 Tax=Spirillospora sp. NPDC048824 TaxID=3364526 RepID=UPI00371B89D3
MRPDGRPTGAPALRVFCLPFAGAGATFYRAWPAAPDGIEIVPLQPTGREERFPEDPYDSIAMALEDLVPALREQCADGRPYALFGHSFGAILAYELAREMSASHEPEPLWLMASGSAAPGVSLGRDSSDLDDDEFIAHVEQLAGYIHPALADPDVREIVLPVLRADVHLHETHRLTDARPLSIPIAVLRGTDDHQVTADDCLAWSDRTTASCVIQDVPGGHMYLADEPEPVLKAMAALASGLLGSRG